MYNATVTVPTTHESTSLHAAAERHKAAIDAVAVDDIQYVLSDATTVVKTVLKAEPKYMAFRGRMDKLTSELDTQLIDDCASYGRAYWYLASEIETPVEEVDARALYAEGIKKRELFETIRAGLGQAEVTSSRNMRPLAGSAGYEIVAADLVKHVAFFRRQAAEIEGKVPITAQDVNHAEEIALALLTESGGKPASQLLPGSPQLAMYQAGTLFLKAYAEVRRAVSFIRSRQGDADEIAPPIYSGRTAPARKPVPAEDAAPATPSAAQPAASAPPAATAPTVTVPVGLKGSSPFTS